MELAARSATDRRSRLICGLQLTLTVVTDIERLYPAWDFDPAVSVKQHWSFEEYGKLIEAQLFGIHEAEAGEKIFGEVIKVWCPGGRQ